MLYDWKAIIEQEEKKTFDFFHLMNVVLPKSNIYEYIGNQTYEEMIFDICQVRILPPFNIEEIIDAKPLP